MNAIKLFLKANAVLKPHLIGYRVKSIPIVEHQYIREDSQYLAVRYDFEDIGVIPRHPHLAGLSLSAIVGLLGHEYGHVIDKVAHIGTIKRSHEFYSMYFKNVVQPYRPFYEGRADWFSGYLLGRARLNPADLIQFLNVHQKHRREDYPDFIESVNLINTGHYLGTIQG